MTEKRIYCDHNATTPVDESVQKRMQEALQIFGNPSSLYKAGRQAKEALESARETLSAALGANPYQCLFCSSGTEANNQVLKQFIEKKVIQNEPVHIISSTIEHSSVQSTLDILQRYNIQVDRVPVDTAGHINMEAYKAAFNPNTKLVSIMMANNETGCIQDIQALSNIAHENGALFHTDAVQAFGKMPINVKKLDVDFLSVSAHKCYAPKGVGALYIKHDNTINPLIHGGGHERMLRASTENIPAILAFETAIEAMNIPQYQDHTRACISLLKHTLSHIENIQFNSTETGLSNTLSVSFPGYDGHAIAMNCDLAGIDISTGSACSVGSIEPSHVLTAIGLDEALNKSSCRFSVGKDNSLEQMDQVGAEIRLILGRMKT